MSAADREDIANAVWLCQNCHKLVDNDPVQYTPDLLKRWKGEAEALAARALSGPSTRLEGYATLPDEVIELGANNAFQGTPGDLRALATRCAIRAIEGRGTRFSIRLLPSQWTSEATHPLARPQYERTRQRYAEPLQEGLELLTSLEAYKYWSYWLRDVPQWEIAITSLLEKAVVRPYTPPGHKVDVWRTAKPALSAPIYLSEAEIDALLDGVKMPNMQCLALGQGNWTALDLPDEVIVKHALPHIVLELIGHDLSTEGQAFNLITWHIGNG